MPPGPRHPLAEDPDSLRQGRFPHWKMLLETYRLNIEPVWFAVGLSTNDANTFHGRHAPEGEVLIVISEMRLNSAPPKNMISQKKTSAILSSSMLNPACYDCSICFVEVVSVEILLWKGCPINI